LDQLDIGASASGPRIFKASQAQWNTLIGTAKASDEREPA